MTSIAFAPRPAPLGALRAPSPRRGHRVAAVALVLAAFSIPVTGTGSALAATHAPAHVRVAAVADSVVGVVATGKHDV
jgi:hypothetical protein